MWYCLTSIEPNHQDSSVFSFTGKLVTRSSLFWLIEQQQQSESQMLTHRTKNNNQKSKAIKEIRGSGVEELLPWIRAEKQKNVQLKPIKQTN